jgi:hypothetical protein
MQRAPVLRARTPEDVVENLKRVLLHALQPQLTL